jgi:hypothetical protein
MRRFFSLREAGRWTLVAGMLFAIAGTGRAQGVRPGLVGPRPTLIQPVVGPDLTVVVNPPTWCNQVSFTATLSPGTSPTLGVLVPVKVRVFDYVFRSEIVVGEVVLMIPATGGSASGTIGWPMPADGSFQPDFTNPIILAVDPDNAVAERNEGNNVVAVMGTCVG